MILLKMTKVLLLQNTTTLATYIRTLTSILCPYAQFYIVRIIYMKMHGPCPEWSICCTEGHMYNRKYKLDVATSKSVGHNAHC
jgi:hypothetical protein